MDLTCQYLVCVAVSCLYSCRMSMDRLFKKNIETREYCPFMFDKGLDMSREGNIAMDYLS